MTSERPAESRSESRAEPGARLTGEWAVCGIVAAAARFIPVPLLDDAVRSRATRVAVARTLSAHGRDFSSREVEPLYLGVEAGMAGLARRALAYLASVPRRILLFPVRKYVALFGSVRGVPNDVMTVVLLGRSVHRALGRGLLTGPESPSAAESKGLQKEAARVRTAFDEAVDGMDLRLLSGALADGLSQGKELSAAAVALARKLARRGDDEDGELPASGPVAEGAEQVEEVLRRPEIARLLAEFDERFDARLA